MGFAVQQLQGRRLSTHAAFTLLSKKKTFGECPIHCFINRLPVVFKPKLFDYKRKEAG